MTEITLALYAIAVLLVIISIFLFILSAAVNKLQDQIKALENK